MVVKMVVRPIAKLSEETRRNERPSHKSSMLRRRASDHFGQQFWSRRRRTAMLFLDATFKAHLKLDQLPRWIAGTATMLQGGATG